MAFPQGDEVRRCRKLIHDASAAGATAMLDIVRHLLRQEEWADFHAEAYRVIKAAIDIVDALRAQETARLAPSKN